MVSNSDASNSNLHKYPSLAHREDFLANQTIIFHAEGTLLKSSSMFPYFMLVAFESGGLLRALILLLLYPILCFVGKEFGLKIMVFVSFVGIKVENFKMGRSVLPKFFLEDVGYEGFNKVMKYGRKVGVSDLPRVMIDGFLRYYLGIDEVFGRELKVVCGYFVGLMETNKENNIFSIEKLENQTRGSDVTGCACLNMNLDHQFFSYCKGIYFITEEEKRNWQVLPREKYPKPLIFHDGRLAFRPTPLSTLVMFLWIPFGSLLVLIRTIFGLLLPYKFSIPILSLTGMTGSLSKPKSLISENSKGTIYVCNHKTLFDPIFASAVLMKPLTAVTYSLSKVSELFSPIKTVRLTRNRENDSKLIKNLLSKTNIAICPEGTTCREPYLLRFSPLFAEMSSDITPVAIDIEVSMFYATTAGGFKFMDPVFLLMNPYINCRVKILDKLPKSLSCEFGGKSKFEIANYVQEQIAKALGFECTRLRRKDKYVFLTDDDGTTTRSRANS